MTVHAIAHPPRPLGFTSQQTTFELNSKLLDYIGDYYNGDTMSLDYSSMGGGGPGGLVL